MEKTGNRRRNKEHKMTEVPEPLPKRVRKRVVPPFEESVRRLAKEANTTEEEILKRLEKLSKGKGESK